MKSIKLKNKVKMQKGFTLIETMVAISIFTVSILAIVSFTAGNISNTSYAKKKLTASYLAGEGIEYFRNMRDTYSLYDPTSGQMGWDAFKVKIDPCDSTNNPDKRCYFIPDDLFTGGLSTVDMPVFLCSGNCPFLKKSPGGEYNYSSGETTDFIREIKTLQISTSEIKVFSTVFWTQGSGQFSTTFTENLFNWIE